MWKGENKRMRCARLLRWVEKKCVVVDENESTLRQKINDSFAPTQAETTYVVLTCTPIATLEDFFHIRPFPLLPTPPILSRTSPEFLSRNLILRLLEPPGRPFLTVLFSLSPLRSLLLFYAILLRSRAIILSIFHRPLIWSEPRICGRKQRA